MTTYSDGVVGLSSASPESSTRGLVVGIDVAVGATILEVAVVRNTRRRALEDREEPA
jgi:hypothetical protein